MKRSVAFTLIVAKELSEEIGKRVWHTFRDKEDFFIRLVQHETYWKDPMQQISVWEFSPSSSRTQSGWIVLFDQIVCHNAISSDGDSLEIAHYSAVGDRNDPFAVLYIPSEWVKKTSEWMKKTNE